MIGFSITMWFVSIVLFFVSISLLKGNYSSMHGKVFNHTKDKVGYAKASEKPVLVMAIGIAASGIAAVVMDHGDGVKGSFFSKNEPLTPSPWSIPPVHERLK